MRSFEKLELEFENDSTILDSSSNAAGTNHYVAIGHDDPIGSGKEDPWKDFGPMFSKSCIAGYRP